jgi:hypothetical protein
MNSAAAAARRAHGQVDLLRMKRRRLNAGRAALPIKLWRDSARLRLPPVVRDRITFVCKPRGCVDGKSELCHTAGLRGGVPEWLKGADCKSVGLRLHWFESSLLHHGFQAFAMVCGRGGKAGKGCLALGARVARV